MPRDAIGIIIPAVPPVALPPTPLPTSRRAELSQRILSAALACFAEAGFEGTSIPAVMARAGVGAGSLYRLFESKEALFNAVFREAKGRLAQALAAPALPSQHGKREELAAKATFDAFWGSLVAFARREPVAFRFLELHHHAPHLDAESRQVELNVLAPLLVTCMDLQRRSILQDQLAPEVVLAFVWGALVGLVKAETLGYVKLDDAAFRHARDACWRAFAAPTLHKTPFAQAPFHGAEKPTRARAPSKKTTRLNGRKSTRRR
ncbi:MAG: TetR/AcrR family transcriptional regulator [Myxococcales bacterium]|nr:TetR/AcrR family transcriptional regulator [Myxococcales bacterium]